jgi:hypothetical protein
MSTFTFEEKLEAVQRELGYRKRVYARRVVDKQMTQALADRQIKLFEEIEADYQQMAQSRRLL